MFKRKILSAKMEENRWKITTATLMQPTIRYTPFSWFWGTF
jgi:hypothetical protein